MEVNDGSIESDALALHLAECMHCLPRCWVFVFLGSPCGLRSSRSDYEEERGMEYDRLVALFVLIGDLPNYR